MPLIDRQWYSYNIDLRDNLTETKKKLPSKEAVNALCDKKAVYAIALLEPFCINYSRSVSSIVYIGSGAVWGRIDQGHKKWMTAMQSRIGVSFKIFVTCPRVQKSPNAFRVVEGDLIRKFEEVYGDYPLVNAQQSFQTTGYQYSESFLDPIFSPVPDTYYAALSVFKGQVFSDVDIAKIA